jgi:hypothetical protein
MGGVLHILYLENLDEPSVGETRESSNNIQVNNQNLTT